MNVETLTAVAAVVVAIASLWNAYQSACSKGASMRMRQR